VERLGHEVRVISTRPPHTRLVSHAWSQEAIARTVYLAPDGEGAVARVALGLRALGRVGALDIRRGDLARRSDWKDVAICAAAAARLCDIVKAEGIEHIHAHSCGRTALIAAFAGRMCAVPRSHTLHGFLRDYGPIQRNKWRGAAFATIITRQIRAETEALIGDAAPARIFIQPMGVDTAAFRRETPYAPCAPGETLRVFSCARLNFHKGHEDLMEAVRLLNDSGVPTELRIAGEDDQGGSGFRANLEAAIAEKGLVGKAILLGSISEPQVLEELRRAHVFALASLKEPLGVAYMEAMACETPTIGTAAGGVPELMTDGENGLMVPPQDPAALAAAIRRLAEDPALAARIGAAGRARVEARFSSAQGARTIVFGVQGGVPDADGEAPAAL